jgi:hypothetical protein
MRVGLTANASTEHRIKATNEAMRFIVSSEFSNSSSCKSCYFWIS